MIRYVFIFFNHTATTAIYTLSLHDALPISGEGIADVQLLDLHVRPRLDEEVDRVDAVVESLVIGDRLLPRAVGAMRRDRKSTRLNSSHVEISYAVFCLKKKKKY